MADETPKPQTGWVRYVINGKGGCGKEKWIYSPGLDHPDMGEEEVVDHIVRHHESWALHAEHYTVNWDTGLTPPAEVIRRQLVTENNNLGYIQQSIAMLEKQLEQVLK